MPDDVSMESRYLARRPSRGHACPASRHVLHRRSARPAGQGGRRTPGRVSVPNPETSSCRAARDPVCLPSTARWVPGTTSTGPISEDDMTMHPGTKIRKLVKPSEAAEESGTHEPMDE